MSRQYYDRLTHRVHIIEANGESYRLGQSRKRLARSKKTTKKINIDNRGGSGYTVKGWYIFAPPGGTILLRRLQ